MDVETAKDLVPNGTLATCGYPPVEREAPFLKHVGPSEVANDTMFGKFTMHGKTGKEVAWLGIVRGIRPASGPEGEVTLLVQHHFFDGLTDCHIMMVGKSGDGDFLAKLKVDPNAIPALSLVRIYGKVTREENKVPLVAVEYVRVWPWMAFTFTDLSGDDHSNPKWLTAAPAKLSDKWYGPYPKEGYYRAVLGDPVNFGLNLKFD